MPQSTWADTTTYNKMSFAKAVRCWQIWCLVRAHFPVPKWYLLTLLCPEAPGAFPRVPLIKGTPLIPFIRAAL